MKHIMTIMAVAAIFSTFVNTQSIIVQNGKSTGKHLTGSEIKPLTGDTMVNRGKWSDWPSGINAGTNKKFTVAHDWTTDYIIMAGNDNTKKIVRFHKVTGDMIILADVETDIPSYTWIDNAVINPCLDFSRNKMWYRPHKALDVVSFDLGTNTFTHHTSATWPSGFGHGHLSQPFSANIYCADKDILVWIKLRCNMNVKVDLTTLVMESWGSGTSGADAPIHSWGAGVYDGSQYVYASPSRSSGVLRIDTTDGSRIGWDGWPAGRTLGYYKMHGITIGGGYLWILPGQADLITRVDINDGSMTDVASDITNTWPLGVIPDINSDPWFDGPHYDGHYVWGLPLVEKYMLRIDPSTLSLQAFYVPGATVGTDFAFMIPQFDQSAFFLIPASKNQPIVRIAVVTMTMTETETATKDGTISDSEYTKTLGTESVTVSVSPPPTDTETDTKTDSGSDSVTPPPTASTTETATHTITPGETATPTFSDDTPSESQGSHSVTKPLTVTESLNTETQSATDTILRPSIQEVFGIRIARDNLTLGSSFGNFEVPSLRTYPSPRQEIKVFTMHSNQSDIVIGPGWFYRFDQIKLTLSFTGGSTRSSESTICERSPCSIFTPIVSMGTTSYTIEASFLERPETFSVSGRFVVDDLIVAGIQFDSFPITAVHSHSALELSVSLIDNFNFSLAGASDVISRENNVSLIMWDLNDVSNTITYTQGLLLATTTFIVPVINGLNSVSTRFGLQATVNCPSIYPVPCGLSTGLKTFEVVTCPSSAALLTPTSGILDASDINQVIQFTNPSPTVFDNTFPGANTMTTTCHLLDTLSGLVSYSGSYQSLDHCTKQCVFSGIPATNTPQLLQVVHTGHGKFTSDLTMSITTVTVSSMMVHRLHIEMVDSTFPFEYSVPDPADEGTIDLTPLCLNMRLTTSEGNTFLWPRGYSVRLWRSDVSSGSNETFVNFVNDTAVFNFCLSSTHHWILRAPFPSQFHLQTTVFDSHNMEVPSHAANLTFYVSKKQSICSSIHPGNLTALPNRLGACSKIDDLHLHECPHNTSLHAEAVFPISPPESAVARTVNFAFIGNAACFLDGASPTYSNTLDSHGKLRSTTAVSDCNNGPEGTTSSVVVAYDDGRYVEFDNGVSFKTEADTAVSITSVSGCTDAFPNTGECSQTGAMPLTIHGTNFYSGISVNISSLQYDLMFPCTSVAFISTVEIVCTAYTGFGSGAQLLLYDGRTDDHHWEVLSTPITVSFATASESDCIDPISGKICGGKGTCDGILGLCTCWGNEAEGYWTGTHCTVCAATHEDTPSNSGCMTPCPIGSDVHPCNSHGTCFSGACTCDVFYRGTECNSKCPGAGAECSGHGVCDSSAVCTCTGNFDVATACETCVLGFSGPNCDLACPRSVGTSDICSSAGICTNGVCVCNANYCGTACETNGAACLECPTAGLWGAGCDKICPGGESTPCSGHGACSNGKTGDGSCFCDPGYWDTDCGEACPGGASTPCSGHGTCSADTGSCTCDPFYATASCGVYCPGAPLNVCSGHGTCSETSTGNGLCNCALGYTGSDCSQTCPGGLASPCNGHGTCNSDATCTCSNGPIPTGYWQGDECDECQVGWYGTECTLQCPMSPTGDQCSSNGVCQSDATCLCYDDNDHGHFTGAACDDCKDGYYGAACLLSCPGGYCDTCSGHGNCSQGINGTGGCTCDTSSTTGYWDDWDCSVCAVSHYGEDCTLSCPGSNYLTGVTCNNHGWCWNGTSGTGGCVCDFNWANGADGSCTECAPGFFGSTCAPCGRNATTGVSCNGHGSCSDGVLGTGACSCSFGFSGVYCEYGCPLASSGSSVCGQGSCNNYGACECDPQWRTSTSPTATADTGSCSQCITGFYGPTCSSPCPTCASGYCDEGPTGSGTCICNDGYWGTLCENLCSGFPASAPCSGHGTCLQATGECSCYADPVNGYWAGTLCTTCADSHAGIPELHNCTKQCPAEDGTVCNGRGTCSDGVCSDCFKKAGDNVNIVCGYSCHIFDQECFASGCPQGFWGLECNRLCPAANDDGTNACNGRGFCDGDTGACLCNVGWSGSACDLTCPTTNIGGSNVVCLGRGQCLNGTCACSGGYWGSEKCEFECPGGASNPCSGYGTCGSDSGACVCDYGSIGDACQNECPGGRANPCNGNGICSSLEERCECYESDDFGYFTGDACQYCAAGFGGGNCTVICDLDHTIPSTTSRHCNCAAGYGSADCSVQCPGYDGGNSWCSGHGTCSEGSLGDGSCLCDTHYYGADCSIFCSPELCTTEAGLVNSACNSEGACVCDTSIGQWAGQFCDECATGWWGGKCNLQCSCNNNGGCVQDSGDCVCFTDAINGYWSGTSCDECLDGYIGLDCRSKNVQLSVSAEVTASGLDIPDLNAPGMILTDMENQIAYVGNRPLLLVDLSGETVVTIRWLIIPSKVIGLHLGLNLPSIPLGAVKFINSTAVECVQPPTVSPSQPPSFLAYSHDGTILSAATTPYAILGSATGLAIVSPVTFTAMTSGAIAPVPKILVHVVDIKGNSVYRYDTSNTRTVMLLIERFDSAGTATSEEVVNSNSTTMLAVDGEALFNQVALVAPREGTITVTALHITDTGATWDASIKLTVTVGRPSYITLVDSSGSANSNATLSVGTRTMINVDVIARIVDEAGNFVVDTSVMPPYLTLQYTNKALDENTGVYSDEVVGRTANVNGEFKYEFSQVPMRTTFGSAYSIDIYNQLEGYELSLLRFTRFSPQICGPAEYGVRNTFTCVACPQFGVCDGSTEVYVQEGYWRASIDAYKFYECTAPYGAGACLSSRCKDGYEGPRCSVCSSGYGKTGLTCSECLDPALSWFIIILIAIFVIGVIFVLVRQSAGDTEGEKEEKGQSALILKIAVSHLQMTALGEFSSDQLPSALKDFFRGSGAASTINPNFSFISCEIAPTFDQQIAFVVVTPFLLVFIFGLIEALRVIRNVQIKNKAQELDEVYDEETRRNHRELMASGLDFSKSKSRSYGRNNVSTPEGIVATTAHSGVFSADLLRSSVMNKSAGIPNLSVYGKYSNSTSQEVHRNKVSPKQKAKGRLGRWVDGFALNTVIIMFMLYPTIVETNSKMLTCDDLDYGSEGNKRYLSVDRSISCDDPAYEGQRTLSLLFMFAFGLGIPIFSVFVVKLMQHLSFRGDMDLARRLFFFMTGSFREELWFWEGILLGRKALLVLIVVLIQDDSLRSYSAMWLMSGFFVLNLKVKPWNHSTLHRLEASSLVCITATYNLTLLLAHFNENQNPITFYFIVSLIFIINIVTLGLFIVAFRAAFKELAQKLATKFPNQFRWLVAALEPSEKERMKKIFKLETECNDLERLIAETSPREVVLANAMREMAARFPKDPKAQALAKDYLRYVATASVRFQASTTTGETSSDLEDFFRVETELLRRWLQLELERNSLSGWAYGGGQDKSSFRFDPIHHDDSQKFYMKDQGPLPQLERDGGEKNNLFSGMINVLNESEMSDFDFGESKNDSKKTEERQQSSISTNIYVTTPRSLLGNTTTSVTHQGPQHSESLNSNLSSASLLIKNIPSTQAEETVGSEDDLELSGNQPLGDSGATSSAASTASVTSHRPRLVRRNKSSIVSSPQMQAGPTPGLNLLQDF